MKGVPLVVELRVRAPWVPGGSFRLELGRPTSISEARKLQERRTKLHRLAVRGDWDVLQAVKAGTLSAVNVLALVDRWGVEDYRAHLPKTAPVGPPVPTLREHVEAWLADCCANPKLRKSTVRQYRKDIERLLGFKTEGAPLEARPWNQVPRHTIRDARSSLDLAPNTVHSALGAWSSFFQWALEREESEAEHQGREPIIQANPVRRARVWASVQTTRHRFLAPTEFRHLLKICPAPMRAQYATLTLAGLRIEELMKLPPAHVRLPDVIHVGKWGTWQPKVRNSTRDVPVHPELLPLLQEYAKEWGGHEVAFFVSPATGRPWTYTGFRNRMEADIEAAGMVYGAWTGKGRTLERDPHGITPHTLRHTFGTWLAQQDVQLMKIALLMGDTEETVRKHYVHYVPTDLSAALLRIQTLETDGGVRVRDRVAKREAPE